MSYATKDIRNIALLGHGGNGKSTLAESILFLTGVTDRMGSTASGNSVSDFDAEEIRRQISISLSTMYTDYQKTKINILDTPGYFDFAGEVVEALRVADTGIIVVSAKDGVNVGAEKAWKSLNDANLPKAIYISKLDEEHADYFTALNALREKFGPSVSPMAAPIVEGGKPVGIVDIVARKAYKYNGSKRSECPVPADMADAVAQKYGVELRRTLTGFKFIGEQIGLLEREGHPERFVFGFEESYGYLSGTHVRDKDGVNAVLLVCEAADWYRRRGMTLSDAMDALYREFGYYACAQKSVCFSGAHAMQEMAARMARLREDLPETIAGFRVAGVTDYLTQATGLPRADVLEFRLEPRAKLILRPSGTEPKLKLYLTAPAPSASAAKPLLSALEQGCAELCID